jgi:hypothetical protein
MAYEIVQFVATHNLSGITPDRYYSPGVIVGNTNQMRLPVEKNVLIKKIAVDCVINRDGDLAVSDYSIQLGILQFDQYFGNNNLTIVNPTSLANNLNHQTIYLNKKNPFINTHFFGYGLFLDHLTGTARGNIIGLSNIITPLAGVTVSFLISVYYEK